MARVFELDDPLSKSVGHHTLMKCEKTKHLSRTVTPPKPLPTEWDSHLLSSHMQTCNCCKPSTTPRIRPKFPTAARVHRNTLPKQLSLLPNPRDKQPPTDSFPNYPTTHKYMHKIQKPTEHTQTRPQNTFTYNCLSRQRTRPDSTRTEHDLYFTKTGHKVQTDQHKNILSKLKQTILQIDDTTIYSTQTTAHLQST